jgi:putative heme-binding domain-containing protein
LATSAADPKVRVQALSTLALIDALGPEIVAAALHDSHPEVRVEALRVSEQLVPNAPALFTDVLALEHDPEFIVRRQLAFTLGAWRLASADCAAAAQEALNRLAANEGDNEQMRPAILSSVTPNSPLMEKLNRAANKPVVAAPLPAVAAHPNPARAKVAESYAGVANLRGDAVHGHQVYRTTCIICHKLKGEGNELGPDLSTVADKPVDWLLTAIFDPNAAVEERYQTHHVTTNSGLDVVGLIVAETANNLVVRMPGGVEQTILRSDLKEHTPLGKSLMPDGLEAVLKEQDVADVIAWIRAK